MTSAQQAIESLQQLKHPRLGPTWRVVGRFETPPEVAGNLPDLSLIQEARQALGYKSNYTLLEWWSIFPVGKWWRYAIHGTRYMASRPNYKYFLKCLMSAARQDNIYKWAVGVLKRVARVDLEHEAQRERPVRPVCRVCNGAGCEHCDPALEKIRTDARYLGLKVDCDSCHGEVCLSCHGRYIALIKEAQEGEKPPVNLNWGALPPVPQ
jgi:hypothetical protein